MNATVSIETITPAQAKKWLENRFEGQRKVREGHVQRMASDILEGKWHLTNDAFSLIKGKLANGQHRCEAIALAGVPCDAMVLRSNDEALFRVMDSGIARRDYDVIAQSGTEDANTLAAAARYILLYQKGLLSRNGIANHKRGRVPGLYITVTRQDVIEYVALNKTEMAIFNDEIKKLYAKAPILSKAQAIAFLMLASPNYGIAAERYITAIYKGLDEKTAPLRDRLLRSQSSTGRMNRAYQFGILIKAFRAYIENKTYSQLRIGPEEGFPTL